MNEMVNYSSNEILQLDSADSLVDINNLLDDTVVPVDDSLSNSARLLIDETLIAEIKSIPDKMAFKIGEVADMLAIKQYVLRFWEMEFEELKPQKSKSNQRIYTKRDVETAFYIRKLLHRDRFSIVGARAALKNLRREFKKEKILQGSLDRMRSLQNELIDIVADVRRLRDFLI